MKLTRKKILVTKNEEKERKTEEVLMEQTHTKNTWAHPTKRTKT